MALYHIIHHFSVQTFSISVKVTDVMELFSSCSNTLKTILNTILLQANVKRRYIHQIKKNGPIEYPGVAASFAWLRSQGAELPIAYVFIVPQSGCTTRKLGSLTNFKPWLYYLLPVCCSTALMTHKQKGADPWVSRKTLIRQIFFPSRSLKVEVGYLSFTKLLLKGKTAVCACVCVFVRIPFKFWISFIWQVILRHRRNQRSSSWWVCSCSIL